MTITMNEAIKVAIQLHICPNCKGENFAHSNSVPVTAGGWHGGQRFAWGRYAGVHLPLLTGVRCEDCGFEASIDPDFD